MRIVSIAAIGLMSALFASNIEAKQPTELVRRGFDDCHHAVYGRAIKFAPGEPQDVQSGTVAMDRVTLSRNVKFDRETNEFVIKHTGIYRINYFIKAYANPSIAGLFSQGSSRLAAKNGFFDGKTLDVAIQINSGRPRAYQRLQPLVNAEEFFSFVGHRSYLTPLRKKDRVKLVVLGVPEIPLACSFFGEGEERTALVAKENGSYVPVVYSDIGGSECERPDIAAYLMVSKAERND